MFEELEQENSEEEKPTITGKIQAIFFQNPANFYKVLLVNVENTNTSFKEKEVVLTGSFGQIQEEESYQFFGKFVDHPKYGTQFQVESYQQKRPTSKTGVVSYLSSDRFSGIGKKTAEKIVEVLGEQAIDEIINQPDCLQKVPGLNSKKRQLIVDTIRLNHGMEKIIINLNQYGFGSQLAFAIYQFYQEETLEIIQENPYQLVEDIEGVGFKRADNLAEHLGIAADSPARIRAALLHELLNSCLSSGDTYIIAERLLTAAIQTLETSRPVEIVPDKVATEIIALVEEGKISQEETKLYENSLFFAEWGISHSIQRFLSNSNEILYDEKLVKKTIRLLEKKLDISYGKSQIEAISSAIFSPFFLLTGGPGTGKTTVINGIVSLFAELNGLSLDPSDYREASFPILLAAPTGRAAKRMNETTGLPSSTIHRLLGLNGREKNPIAAAKELEGGLLIIDEMSMVDTWLANTLLKSIPTNMQVIFVGDKDQLPSVGPGQVFHDLLSIQGIPKVELDEIYRQGNESTIIPLAHAIKNGEIPKDFTKNKKDRSFFACDALQIEPIIRQVVTKAKAKGYTAQDIQLLAPMYRGISGIDALNKMMQEVFNPNSDGMRKEVLWNDKIYRIGDKVLQLVNAPELNVFNGDMGEIVSIILAKESEDKIDELVIQFDNNEVVYKRNEWNKITLAYCCSIHKSQGSEFKMVILPMVHQYQRMLRRNLLYTAVTRSKDLLILLGESQAFFECIQQASADRNTTLKERINLAEEMPLNTRLAMETYENEFIENTVQSFENPLKEDKNEKKISENRSEEKKEVENPTFSRTFSNREKMEEDGQAAALSLFHVEEESSNYEEKIKKATNSTKSFILCENLVQSQEIDPLIGMEGKSPYDFVGL